MTPEITLEALLTFPGPTRSAARGHAHLMRFDAGLVAIGELDDNPGQDTIGAIEVIAAGLAGAGLVSRGFTLLHYLPRDHVNFGRPAVWQVVWRARDAMGVTQLGKPTWDPVPEDLAEVRDVVLQTVGNLEPYGEAEISDRTSEVIDLLEADDLAERLNALLDRDDSESLWTEISEMAFGDGAAYEPGTGRVTEVVGVEYAGIDRWRLAAKVDLNVDRPDSEISPDIVEVRDYDVTFEASGGSFPSEVVDLWVFG